MAAGSKNIQVLGGDHWKAALDAIRKTNLVLHAGVLSSAQNSMRGGIKIAPYAFFNEYGLGGIPARPFMRKTIEKDSKEWAHLFADRMRGRVTDKGAVREVLESLGNDMKAAILDTIHNEEWPPNSPATLARKNPHGDPGKDKPLHDTGALVTSGISWEVVEGGGA